VPRRQRAQVIGGQGKAPGGHRGDAWHQCTNNLNRGVYILGSSRVQSPYDR
jgi:hypothetical protein